MSPKIFEKFRNVGRLTSIVNILARHGFQREIETTELGNLLADDALPTTSSKKEGMQRLSRPQRLARAFEELGPTFIKLGQMLSTREDLVPKTYVDEFKRLRDRVKPVPFAVIEKILSEQLPPTRHALIESIEHTPIGSASIGQVHRARLKDGRDVVFKIQRPHVDQDIQNDLGILMTLSALLETAFPELKAMRLTQIVAELKRSLLCELDYLREAGQTERMARFFQDKPHIEIPSIFYEFCTPKILCMSELKGERISPRKRQWDNPTALIGRGIEAFLDMTFVLGTFHADLHPGNFIVMPQGRLGILDFGLTARLKRELRNTMSLIFYALSEQDVETAAALSVGLTESEDVEINRELETEVMDVFETLLSTDIQNIQLGKLMMQVARLAAQKNIPFNRDLILFFRGIMALETFAKTIDPKFKIFDFAAEYSQKNALTTFDKKAMERTLNFIWNDSQAFLKELPLTLRIMSKKLQQGNLSFQWKSEDVQNLGREIERSSTRLSLSILLGTIVLGTSIATYGKQGYWDQTMSLLGAGGFALAVLLGLWMMIGMVKSK